MSERRDKIAAILAELDATPEQMAVLHHCADQWEESERKLRASEQRSRAVLETTVDGVITIGEDGMVRSFNPAAERIFGYVAEEVIGQNIRLLMPTPYREEHDSYIQNYTGTGVAKVIGIGREVEGLRKNGETFPLDLAVSEVNVDDERTFTGIVRDVAARKKVERALEEERVFVSAILNTAHALVIVLDHEGNIVRFNRACEVTTGYALEEVRGRSLWEVLIPADEAEATREIFFQQVRDKRRTSHDNVIRTKDDNLRLVSWTNTVLTSATGKVEYVVGTGIDITDQQKAVEALVSISEDVRRLIGQELHDALGQQLTGISLLTKSLERRLRETGREEQEVATEITELVRNAVGDVRRLSHGLYPVELERHGLDAALEELAEANSRRSGVQCRYNHTPLHRKLGKTSALNLYRIAQEATTNALRHADAQQILIDLFPSGKSIHLVIRDDGVGFDAEREMTRGLGLSIMRYRAKLLGATVEIESTLNKGTTVTCRMRDGRRPHADW